jgi:nucleoside-diphosphate-sugar epimerase
VEAPADIRFAILYATSQPVGSSMYDLDRARDLLGFEPRDRWPEGIEEMF